jgi:hypothetical protein
MPNYRDYQRAMHQGPAKEFDAAEEAGIDNSHLSELLPPYNLDTGPIDERTQMMLEALQHFGSQSRMPHIDPDIPPPDPEGALRHNDIGMMNEWNNEGDAYNVMDEQRVHYPEGTRMHDVYNPAVPPDEAQAMMRQLLEEYLAGRGQ